MQKILGYMRKAIQEFDLIQDGDKIAVGVSGGKDSLVLLNGLVLLKRFIGIDYDVAAITIDPRFNKQDGDFHKIAEMCERLEVEYRVVKSDIAEVVFDIRQEKSPCSLCSKMRRGALHDTAKEVHCNKIALGHNFEDVVETFVMNLFIEGRLGCFSPQSYLSRKDVTVIRPLVFAPEKIVRSTAARCEMPIVKSKCPVDGHTKREETKLFLREMDKKDDGFSYRLFGALRRSGLNGWGMSNTSKENEK